MFVTTDYDHTRPKTQDQEGKKLALAAACEERDLASFICLHNSQTVIRKKVLNIR
jgi:hypothetical protein